MRGSFGLLRNTNGVIGSAVIGEAAKLVSCSTFSTSSGPGGGSGGGGGRGRGRGSFANPGSGFVAGSIDPGKMNSNEDSNSNAPPYPSMGRGHGRGNPLPSPPFSPLPNTFVSPGQPPQQQPGVGRGRGGMADEGESRPKGPIFLRKEDGIGSSSIPGPVDSVHGQPQNIVKDEIGSSSIPGPVDSVRGQPQNISSIPGPFDSVRGQPQNIVKDGMGISSIPGPVDSVRGQPQNISSIPGPFDSVRGQPQNIVKAGMGSSSIPGPFDSVRGQPQNVVNVLTGTGRGKPERKPVHEERPREDNRHLRPRRDGRSGPVTGAGSGRDRFVSKESSADPNKPKLSPEEAVKAALEILARKAAETEGGRGKGRGTGRGRGRGRGRGSYDDEDEGEEVDNLFMGDDADGEKLAQKLGPTVMAELTEAFEDLSSEILPDPIWDEYVEAYDTNLKHELEPEYLMGDFETNPDIHENPPIPLREALEKMKPFLMSYEGIESQEEWEEAMKETMERVPLLKNIVDHYCGPDRVTAKQQQGELERVAKTLPASAPNAVTRFTDRAVLSLQSNPGWGFDKKCQFMDKAIAKFSKAYK